MKKDIRKQVLFDREDLRILRCLQKIYLARGENSSETSIIRRGLRCLLEKEKKT